MIKEDDLMTGGSNFTKIIKDTMDKINFHSLTKLKCGGVTIYICIFSFRF